MFITELSISLLLEVIIGGTLKDNINWNDRSLILKLFFIKYIPTIVVLIILAKRRLNDMNGSGWLCLLLFVPFISLLMPFWLTFGPGSKGPNYYGPEPTKNTIGVKIAAALSVLIFLLLIVSVTIMIDKLL